MFLDFKLVGPNLNYIKFGQIFCELIRIKFKPPLSPLQALGPNSACTTKADLGHPAQSPVPVCVDAWDPPASLRGPAVTRHRRRLPTATSPKPLPAGPQSPGRRRRPPAPSPCFPRCVWARPCLSIPYLSPHSLSAAWTAGARAPLPFPCAFRSHACRAGPTGSRSRQAAIGRHALLSLAAAGPRAHKDDEDDDRHPPALTLSAPASCPRFAWMRATHPTIAEPSRTSPSDGGRERQRASPSRPR